MINKRFAVVTGASSGIGKAIAAELASRKYNLILHSLPNQGLKEYCSELHDRFGVEAFSFEADLTQFDGPGKLYEFVRIKGCKIYMLVNNAGVGYEGPVECYTQKQIDNMILLNIRALTLLTFYLSSELRKNEPSYLLNISSFGCYFPTAYKSIYLATKSYIYFFTRALESEFRGTPVRTCVVVPSAVRTNPVVLDRIKRNGWFSGKSALDPEEVATESITGMLKGKKVIMPGRFTRLFFSLGMIVPVGLMIMLTRRIFSNYHNDKK